MKPVPVIAAEFTVTADVPVDDSVTDSVVGDPISTVPKLKLVTFRANFGFGTANPVPLSEITRFALVAELLMIVTLPLTAPAVVGANVTWPVRD